MSSFGGGSLEDRKVDNTGTVAMNYDELYLPLEAVGSEIASIQIGRNYINHFGIVHQLVVLERCQYG